MDPHPSIDRKMPWPLFTIDFEASGLQPDNFPIEVGVCRWTAPAQPMEGWSALILPSAGWDESGTWSKEAEAIHGIRRSDLQHGLAPDQVVGTLNSIIGASAAFCDGGAFDFAWTRRLIMAAGAMNTFRLGAIDMLTGLLDQAGQVRRVRWLDRTPVRHRARDDAERLMKALAVGLDVESELSIACSLTRDIRRLGAGMLGSANDGLEQPELRKPT